MVGGIRTGRNLALWVLKPPSPAAYLRTKPRRGRRGEQVSE